MILFYAIVLLNSIFEANVRYTAQELNCVEGQMVLRYEGNNYPIELFNVDLNAEGYLAACSLIEDASVITFEFDESVNRDTPFSLWVFLDGELLQKQLIQSEMASVRVANPTYKYMDQCRDAEESMQVFAPQMIYKEADYTQKGGIVCLTLISATLIYCAVWFFLAKRKKASSQKEKTE